MSNNSFTVTSRYYAIDTATMTLPDGTTVAYVRRRIVPPAERFSPLLTYTVAEGDRPDNVAAEYLGDPEQFWRLCDANNTLEPEDLTATPGSTVRITLPEGVPGLPNA